MMQQATIELKQLAFFARHGVLEEEARLGQRFRVDVRARLLPNLPLDSDSTDDTVNYVELYELVKSIVEGRRFNLIEACADAVAREALDRFEKIAEITVVVQKPSVPVDCICDYFSAEVTRCR